MHNIRRDVEMEETYENRDEPTFSDCRRFLNVLKHSKPVCMDDMIKKVGLSPKKCILIYDLLAELSAKMMESAVYNQMSVLKEQLELVSQVTETLKAFSKEMSFKEIGEVDLRDINTINNTVSKNIETVSNLHSKLAAMAKEGSSIGAGEAAMKALFKILSKVDPILAINVREEAVKQLSEIALSVAPIPGGDNAAE